MKNADSPAMPTLKIEEYKCSEGLPAGCFQTKQRTVNHNGLTKREMFAMHAMPGVAFIAPQIQTAFGQKAKDLALLRSEAVAFA